MKVGNMPQILKGLWILLVWQYLKLDGMMELGGDYGQE
jgi:hypothetical protein